MVVGSIHSVPGGLMISTTHGDMDESRLTKKEGEIDDENEHTSWVEYYLGDELVHRSAHVRLKRNVVAEALAASFG
jgi:hypothetical protein